MNVGEPRQWTSKFNRKVAASTAKALLALRTNFLNVGAAIWKCQVSTLPLSKGHVVDSITGQALLPFV